MRGAASSLESGSRRRSWSRRWPTSRPADGDPRTIVEEAPAMLLRPFVRNGRPGLIGTMARTTVVVGVAGGVSRRQQAKAQQGAGGQARRRRQAAAGEPAAPADPIAQLKELA